MLKRQTDNHVNGDREYFDWKYSPSVYLDGLMKPLGERLPDLWTNRFRGDSQGSHAAAAHILSDDALIVKNKSERGFAANKRLAFFG